MSGEGIRKRRNDWAHWQSRHGVREREPATGSPIRLRAFVRLHWALVAKWLLLLVGFAVQWWIICAVWELVDLVISLMELWAELARKHLEITLS